MLLYRSMRIDGSRFFRVPRNGGSLPARANPNSREYETSVSAVLSIIARRQTGRIVLDMIDQAVRISGHTLTIVPTTVDDNAFAEPRQGRGAFPSGAPVRSGDNGNVVRRNGQPLLGTGTGSDVRLLFNPRNLNPRASTFIALGATPNEILLHELVHAIRQLSHRLTNVATGTPFGNEDEFLSIVVADIYASEGGATGLRANHALRLPRSVPSRGPATRGALGGLAASRVGTMFDLPSSWRGSAPALDTTFEAGHRGIFQRLHSQEGDLFRSLARVPAQFNPIREHLIVGGTMRRPPAVRETAPSTTAAPQRNAAQLPGDSTLPAAMQTPLQPAPSGPLRW